MALGLASSDSQAAEEALKQAVSLDAELGDSVAGKSPGDEAVLLELQARIQSNRL